ncbi:hypothetical protein NE857_24795 [Nocardiopsis exhalans]|uniref:Secreted protein n=1 Tax=Nocardiopsis exhalans TaxID=163604 RepID=A0ABY5D2A6_9ACTN|nr:hypothetical protein [Nocardiopsis exhalans]USY18497.1 hypothetical protein NE857_24795 [Nocardiopsis exhalans]
MFEWPALGALIAVAVPVGIIFLVLGVFRIVQRQAERAVRSPEYWDEVPDGRRYPTGWGEDDPAREAGEEPADDSEEGSAGTAAQSPQAGEGGQDPPRTDGR